MRLPLLRASLLGPSSWLLLSFQLASCGVEAPAQAQPVPAAPAALPAPALVEVGPALTTLTVPYDEALLDALRARRWPDAAKRLTAIEVGKLPGDSKGSHAFVTAWALIHAERGAEAVGLLPLASAAAGAPADYLALIEGEALLATEDRTAALDALARVPSTSLLYPRATLRRAEALRGLSRTKEAWELVESLVARPDPAPGNAEALLGLATHYGVGSPKAYPLLRRLWAAYPGSPEAAKAEKHLASYAADPAYKATWQEATVRAERLMNAGKYTEALALLEPLASKLSDSSVDGCRGLFVRGRSAYKLNQLTNAATFFGEVGSLCAKVDGDYGARSLYLQGTAEMRRKRFTEAARRFEQLSTTYPSHSMTDDGWTLAGKAYVEAGDAAKARAVWLRAAEQTPDGDTVPEALLSLAFASYQAGDVADARQIAARLGQLPLHGSHVEVEAGRYWAARWLLYPDAKSPRALTTDAAARAEGVAGLRQLCIDLPWSFYAILAHARLAEVAPTVAAEVAMRKPLPEGALTRPWRVRAATWSNERIQRGAWLMRVGLSAEARAEWADQDFDALTGDEMAWLMQLQIASGDWLIAHDLFRRWLRSHPLGTHDGGDAAIARVAYPDRYWDEVQASVKSTYRYEPRYFHALSREESNFNRKIVSFAGARGLSQLMPATARETAGWMKMTITMDDLDDPKTNLTLGARYLDQMLKQLDGSPYLALAAYNAGAGRANQWTTEWTNPPTDEFVERIPFRETHGYVKRVMGTWQVYRTFFGDGPLYQDLSTFNHHAQPIKAAAR